MEQTSEPNPSGPPEAQKLALEREKWTAEAAMRQREIELKEREQRRLDAESEARIEDARRSRWSSPLVLAVLGAGLAGVFSVIVSLVNGIEQREQETTRGESQLKVQLESNEATLTVQRQNNEAQQKLEEFKADSARLLQMIGTNDPDKAAENLQFLLDAGLIGNENVKNRLTTFLKDRKPGQGPALPAPGSTPIFGKGPRSAPLGSYPVDPGQVSVAGFSSGAFMANQMHIAHSADIMGAAMIGGGLYGCAVEEVTKDGVAALASKAVACTSVPFMLDDVSPYKDRIEKLAAKGWIDPPASLARAKVYFFTGSSDDVVASEAVEKGKALYDALGVPAGSIVFEDRSGPAAKAGHSWVSNNYGGACAANRSPFINDCSYDQAGAELKAIYGRDLTPPVAASGNILAFDQTEFVPGRAAAASGLSDTGYLYVPKPCESGAAQRCRLHVVLHGCKQSAEELSDVFITKIGVNEWADANHIIVLYPQAHATTPADLPAGFVKTALQEANPNGCWNWWGYAGDPQYLTKKGVQVDAIWRMVRRLEGNSGGPAQ